MFVAIAIIHPPSGVTEGIQRSHARRRQAWNPQYALDRGSEAYFVLSLSWGARGTEVRLVSEQAWTPVLFSLDEFDIVDARMPATWRLSRPGSLTVLQPEQWGGAFWESYFDGDPAAVRLTWKMADQMCDDLGDPHIERDDD